MELPACTASVTAKVHPGFAGPTLHPVLETVAAAACADLKEQMDAVKA